VEISGERPSHRDAPTATSTTPIARISASPDSFARLPRKSAIKPTSAPSAIDPASVQAMP
jgi:hypothetical protein